ncbi:hypothetical protein [Streptomyces sp. SID3343]|uniref:hypothetical protein n=1 Tax=Streptomyces sp. SID3343 TaxID=2690260 RepID=UPI001370B1D7|nr:hypothetical protein [Streptomyces sp. SID3343]MYW05692.1 hypothetical protein [Streptomyces sp. SID3343]
MTDSTRREAQSAEPLVADHRTDMSSPVHHLGHGPTAYHGMSEITKAGVGDVVPVSGAAGGVGSPAGRIAECRGARRCSAVRAARRRSTT